METILAKYNPVGRLLASIEKYAEFGLTDNTLIIYTSDNGPWLNYGNHAGSAGKLREGKNTVFEGGFRMPCIMKWHELKRCENLG